MNWYFGRPEQYTADLKIPDSRIRAVFSYLSKCGAGIELNMPCFPQDWRESEDARLRMFRIAAEENCKFYCGSDAHDCKALIRVPQKAREIVDLIGLTADNLFIPS